MNRQCVICREEVNPLTSLIQFKFLEKEFSICEKEKCYKKFIEQNYSAPMSVSINSSRELIFEIVRRKNG